MVVVVVVGGGGGDANAKLALGAQCARTATDLDGGKIHTLPRQTDIRRLIILLQTFPDNDT